MRAAALRLVLFALFLLVLTSGNATAQVPDPGSVVSSTTDTVSDVVSSTTDTVSSTTDPVVSSSTDTVSSTTDTVIDTVTDTAGSGSGAVTGSSNGGGSAVLSTGSTVNGAADWLGGGSSRGGTVGSGSATGSARTLAGGGSVLRPTLLRTKFDRLPRRFEALLESIEAGLNVRANLRRLEQALASAPPEIGRRVLRQLRAEIAHLRQGGVTRVERRRIERLRFAVKFLERDTAGQAPAFSARPTPAVNATLPGRSTVAAEAPGGPASPASTSSLRSAGAPLSQPPTFDRPSGGGSLIGLPSGGWHPALFVYLALVVLLVLSLVGLVLAAVPPYRLSTAGRLQEFVRWSRPDLAVTAGATLAALTILVLFSALV